LKFKVPNRGQILRFRKPSNSYFRSSTLEVFANPFSILTRLTFLPLVHAQKRIIPLVTVLLDSDVCLYTDVFPRAKTNFSIQCNVGWMQLMRTYITAHKLREQTKHLPKQLIMHQMTLLTHFAFWCFPNYFMHYTIVVSIQYNYTWTLRAATGCIYDGVCIL
jgi:hypothetical protein